MRQASNSCRKFVAAATLLIIGATIGLAPAEVLAAPGPGKRAKAATGEQARDPDDAKLRTGIALFEARNYTRALAEFERAHMTTKRARALYWIARTNEESNHRATALGAFERYLREASPEANTRDATEVMGRVQMLTLQLGLVTVSAPAGAAIAIDDVTVGNAPLAGPIYVEPGPHTVTADGNDRQVVDLEPEGHAAIQFTVHERKNALAAEAPVMEIDTAAPAPTVAEKHPVRALTVGGVAVAGLLAASSVYFTIKALGSASDFAQKKGELGASREELEHLQGQTRLQTGIALGTGVSALAVAGLTLLVFRKPSQTETRVGFTGSRLDISGRFQ